MSRFADQQADYLSQENKKLREALQVALDQWEEHMSQSGRVPMGSPEYGRIAEFRKLLED